MSALGIAGDVAGLLSLTIQIIGSIKPISHFIKHIPVLNQDISHRVDDFCLLLEAALNHWQQEPPAESGSIIQALDACHQKVLGIKDKIGKSNNQHNVLRDTVLADKIQCAIDEAITCLQLNLSLQHRYATYKISSISNVFSALHLIVMAKPLPKRFRPLSKVSFFSIMNKRKTRHS